MTNPKPNSAPPLSVDQRARRERTVEALADYLNKNRLKIASRIADNMGLDWIEKATAQDKGKDAP
jgi:hypothetical protein